MIEDWKQIEEYDRYFISNKGRVYSQIRKRLLKPFKNTKGYTRVRLGNNSGRRDCIIHILVAKYFIGKSNLQINHKDSNKENNCVENLEYVTCRDNQNHFNPKLRGCYNKRRKKWVSAISINGKIKYLGGFKTQEEAHKAYTEARKELGEVWLYD